MSEMEFGLNSENYREYYPQYANIDWHYAYISRHGDEQLSAWAETFDEYGEFCEQLTQENCCFYLNDTNKDFDCLVVIDERDESGDFWFTRQQLGSDNFDKVLANIETEVMIVKTKYPIKMVAEFVLKIMMNDI